MNKTSESWYNWVSFEDSLKHLREQVEKGFGGPIEKDDVSHVMLLTITKDGLSCGSFNMNLNGYACDLVLRRAIKSDLMPVIASAMRLEEDELKESIKMLREAGIISALKAEKDGAQ